MVVSVFYVVQYQYFGVVGCYFEYFFEGYGVEFLGVVYDVWVGVEDVVYVGVDFIDIGIQCGGYGDGGGV